MVERLPGASIIMVDPPNKVAVTVLDSVSPQVVVGGHVVVGGPLVVEDDEGLLPEVVGGQVVVGPKVDDKGHVCHLSVMMYGVGDVKGIFVTAVKVLGFGCAMVDTGGMANVPVPVILVESTTLKSIKQMKIIWSLLSKGIFKTESYNSNIFLHRQY